MLYFLNPIKINPHELQNIKKKTLSDILNSIGYTAIHYKFILLCIICQMLWALQQLILTIIVIPMADLNRWSEGETSIVTAIVYLGAALNSFSLTWMTRLMTRSKFVMINLLLLNVFYLVFSTADNLYLIYLSRFVCGGASTVCYKLLHNMLIEYLPTNTRGFVIGFIVVFQNLMKLIIFLIVVKAMSNLEIFRLREVLVFSTLILFVSSCLFCIIRGNRERLYIKQLRTKRY